MVSKKDREVKAWMVGKFPVTLRQKFVGVCRIRGERVVDVLMRLVSKYVFEEMENEQRGR